MPLIATAGSSKSFKPCPAGVHDAVCAFVEDLGWEYSEIYQKESRKVVLVWEINEPMEDGKPYMISKRYTLSLNEKAAMRKDLEGWRGQKFTDEQLKGFDLEVLRGKQCQLQIIHNEKDGKVYANIQTILPKGKHSPTIHVVATEVPEWIIKTREENEAAHAKLNAAPVVVLDDKPKVPAAVVDDGSVPF
jgi:hypothetical protein